MTAKFYLAHLYTQSEELTKAKEILTSILRQSEDCQEKMLKIIVIAKFAMADIYQEEGKYRAAEALQLEVVAFYESLYT